MTLGMQQLEWRGYETVKTMKIYLFVSAESTNVTDRQTDGRTDTT